jgi:hypothetical protein
MIFFSGVAKKVSKLLLTNGIYLLLPGINLVLILEFVSFAIKIDLQQKKPKETAGCRFEADRCSSGPRKKANYNLKRLEFLLEENRPK